MTASRTFRFLHQGNLSVNGRQTIETGDDRTRYAVLHVISPATHYCALAFSSEIAGAALVDDRLQRHTRLGQQRREASHAEAGSQEACPVRRVRRRRERVCSITVERRPGVRERLLRLSNRQRSRDLD